MGITELSGKEVLVYGAGASGVAAAKLLLSCGAKPCIYDGNEKLDCASLKERIGGEVEIVTGAFTDSLFDRNEILIMSPGVPTDLPEVQRFYDAKKAVWGEIELAYRLGRGEVFAITGTNGKTTTTALLGEIMRAQFDEVYVVGNIGNPYTEIALDSSDAAKIVAEISSFQLETIEDFHPRAAIITNITEDHLNRHHTMENYIEAKFAVVRNQTAEDLCVLNYDDEVLRAFAKRVKGQCVFFSSSEVLDEGICIENDAICIAKKGVREVLVEIKDLQLLGTHNYENIMAAVAVAEFAGVERDRIREAVKGFSGVAHRIEFIREAAGVRYYNDSKGTNPDAAIKAIKAMRWPTWLIAGGYDKQAHYEEWIQSFDGRVRELLLIGETKEKIREAAISVGFPEDQIRCFADLDEALHYAAEHAKAGEAVLLSPACASWDQFKNYEVRGDRFRELVEQI